MTDQDDVKDNFRTEITAAIAPVPFHDSINSETESISDLNFVTCSFDVFDAQNYCYGKTKRLVTGICYITVFTIPGIGDKINTDLCDKLVTHFTGLTELPGTEIYITTVTDGVEETSGDAENRYGQTVSVEYEYYN